MERNQVTFYRSFWTAIRKIRRKEDRLSAYEAILSYALDGEVLPMTDVAESVFILVKPVLDSASKRAESGKQGGSKAEASRKQTESKPQAIRKQGERRSYKEGEKEGEVEVESDSYKGARNAKSVFSEFCDGDDELLLALTGFEKMRKDIKKPLSDRAKELLLKKLQEYPRADWVGVLNQSVLNCWQGIFPLEKRKSGVGTNNIFLQLAEEGMK